MNAWMSYYFILWSSAVLFLFPSQFTYSQRLNALPLKQKPVSGSVSIHTRYLIQNHGLFPTYDTTKNGRVEAAVLKS